MRGSFALYPAAVISFGGCRMVCRYEDFLSLLTRRAEDVNPPAGLINLGNRWFSNLCSNPVNSYMRCRFRMQPCLPGNPPANRPAGAAGRGFGGSLTPRVCTAAALQTQRCSACLPRRPWRTTWQSAATAAQAAPPRRAPSARPASWSGCICRRVLLLPYAAVLGNANLEMRSLPASALEIRTITKLGWYWQVEVAVQVMESTACMPGYLRPPFEASDAAHVRAGACARWTGAGGGWGGAGAAGRCRSAATQGPALLS